MSITMKDKMLKELEKIASRHQYECITHPLTANRGKLFFMKGFASEASILYSFTHRDFSLLFYEKGQEPIMGKPMSDFNAEDILYHQAEKIEEILTQFSTYLSKLNTNRLAG